MKLNNKGFAISAILYTLLILFTLTLISLITGLNSRNRILEKSIETIERKYNWNCKYKDDENDPVSKDIPNIKITDFRGKYIFANDTSTTECYTYLNKSTNITDPRELDFTTSECNTMKNNTEHPLGLIAICY